MYCHENPWCWLSPALIAPPTLNATPPPSTSMDDASFLTICLTGCNKLYWKYRPIKKLVSTLFMLFVCCVEYRLSQNQRVFWPHPCGLVTLYASRSTIPCCQSWLFILKQQCKPVLFMWVATSSNYVCTCLCYLFLNLFQISFINGLISSLFPCHIKTFDLFIRIWQFSSNIYIFIFNWDSLVVWPTVDCQHCVFHAKAVHNPKR